jgi:DNA-binding beta-propeller fold protein YncE
MKWAPNATSGILVAGTGVSGNSSQQLHSPYGLYLDENNSYLYIADLANSRIQRYSLNTTTNGTTVAGGNGAGSGSNQLNQPYGICVSKQTGDIYIADFNNNRIQRWSPGATSGVTIVGITGVSGINATLLNGPANVILNKNETFLYVTDRNNHRVQRFQLT